MELKKMIEIIKCTVNEILRIYPTMVKYLKFEKLESSMKLRFMALLRELEKHKNELENIDDRDKIIVQAFYRYLGKTINIDTEKTKSVVKSIDDDKLIYFIILSLNEDILDQDFIIQNSIMIEKIVYAIPEKLIDIHLLKNIDICFRDFLEFWCEYHKKKICCDKLRGFIDYREIPNLHKILMMNVTEKIKSLEIDPASFIIKEMYMDEVTDLYNETDDEELRLIILYRNISVRYHSDEFFNEINKEKFEKDSLEIVNHDNSTFANVHKQMLINRINTWKQKRDHQSLQDWLGCLDLMNIHKFFNSLILERLNITSIKFYEYR